MILWLALASLCAAVVAALLVPLLRPPAAVAGGQAVAIHRDRLAEVRRDRDRGLISRADAVAAETEIARQMLATAREEAAEPPLRQDPRRGPLRWTILAVVTVFIPGAAVGLYLILGTPQLAIRGGAQAVAVDAGTEHRGGEMGQAVAHLADRLREKPDDLDGWILLARSYAAIGAFEPAADSYRRALELSGGNPSLRSAYGEALVMAAAGTVTESARRAFEETLADLPADPRSRYYLGLAEVQAGRADAALQRWLALVRDSPPGAAWLPVLRAAIIELGGVPPDPGEAELPPMAAGDDAMIRGMVARLAERLEQAPADVEGWQRLARSYEVLGEHELASEARRRAELAAAAGTAEQRAAVAAALAAAGGGAAQPRPADPDDLVGWVRLAQSHLAAGRSAEAKSAFAEAIARDPTNLTLLLSYAEAQFGAPQGPVALPPEALQILRNLLSVDADNPGALWLLAVAEAEAGNRLAAAERLRHLSDLLPAGSPAHTAVGARLDALAADR